MSEVIRRVNQFEVDLEKIEDPVIREAFNNVLNLVRSLQGDGYATNGVVEAREILNLERSFRVTSRGEVLADYINLGEGGKWRTKCFNGVLSDGDTEELAAPNGEIWGIVGWSESTETTSGETNWYPIEYGTVTNRVYIRAVGSNTNGEGRVNLGNSTGSGSGAQDLQWRLIMFYREINQAGAL